VCVCACVCVCVCVFARVSVRSCPRPHPPSPPLSFETSANKKKKLNLQSLHSSVVYAPQHLPALFFCNNLNMYKTDGSASYKIAVGGGAQDGSRFSADDWAVDGGS